VSAGAVALRRVARRTLRAGLDLARGDVFRLARASAARRALGAGLPEQLAEGQPIRRSELWENKVHNLRLAAARIEDVAVLPGEVFSFWALVGAPSGRAGYRPGRTLVAGAIRATAGGGLCQLSGILHALALRAGLEIRERHAHSVDLYDDATRFAPLGSDATVAHGAKDLRLVNTLGQPLCFRFEVRDGVIEARLCARAPVREHPVEHRVISRSEGEVVVETLRGAGAEQRSLGLSRYATRGAAGVDFL